MILNKIRCKIFGHKWKYNFKSIPNKAICPVCYLKSRLNLSTREWESVPNFEGDSRTNEELSRMWFK